MNASPPIMRMLLAASAMLVVGSALGQPVAGTGYVDEIRYFARTGQLVVSGWAAPEKASVFTFVHYDITAVPRRTLHLAMGNTGQRA